MCSEEAHGMHHLWSADAGNFTAYLHVVWVSSLGQVFRMISRFLEWSLVTSKTIAQQNLPQFPGISPSSMFLGLYRICRFWQLAFGRGLPAEPEASGQFSDVFCTETLNICVSQTLLLRPASLCESLCTSFWCARLQFDVRQSIKLYWCIDFSPWIGLTVAFHIFSHLFTRKLGVFGRPIFLTRSFHNDIGGMTGGFQSLRSSQLEPKLQNPWAFLVVFPFFPWFSHGFPSGRHGFPRGLMGPPGLGLPQVGSSHGDRWPTSNRICWNNGDTMGI
jgi:hypothetical protein